jgi:diguanylate cyclase (GGDEF)-like protein/PAS domain S-box-containing protein
MYAMYFKEDPWSRDSEFLRFNELAAEFILLRDRLMAMGLTLQEREALATALEIIRSTQPLQEDIVNRLKDNRADGIEQLIQEDLPLENHLLTVFDDFIALVRSEIQIAAIQTGQDARNAFLLLSGVTLIVLGLTLWAMLFVRQRILSVESSLFEEKELEELTLQNITDGVIKTDAMGYILSMNPVAMQLTGWKESQALGQPLEKVYALRQADSDIPLERPEFLAEALGTISRLARYLCLGHRNGGQVLIEEAIAPIHAPDGRLVQVAYIFRDVTWQKRESDRMAWQAAHDPLTRVLNRNGFGQVLERALGQARRTRIGHCLIYIDLDDFKPINDRYGHALGDELLINLCRTIESCMRMGDHLARLGGDEFALLLRNCSLEQALGIAEEVRQQIEQLRLQANAETEIGVGVSIGIAPLDGDSGDAWRAVKSADQACYLAKRDGKNRVRLSA